MIDPFFYGHLQEFGFMLDLIREGSYVGIFFISILVSYLLPFPEAIALLLFGFVARVTGIDLPGVIAVSVLGTIIGDNILYRLSFFGNTHVERFNRKMRANKLIQYENLVVDHIGKSLLFLRLVTGVRFFGPVIAGTLGVNWRKFFFYNAGATILHGSIFILMGFLLHRRIFSTVVEVEIVRNILLFSSVFIVAILLKIFSKKKA